MSYRIEYQWGAFRIRAGETGLAEDRYIVAIEGGDNNCWEYGSRRRARDWSACMIGTRSQVLKQAIWFAGDCEGGSLQPHNRRGTPESYIRRIRRLLDGPKYLDPAYGRGWMPEVRISTRHPLVEDLRELGIELTEEERYGITEVVARFPNERIGEFFELVDRHIHELRAWHFARVYGLGSS